MKEPKNKKKINMPKLKRIQQIFIVNRLSKE